MTAFNLPETEYPISLNWNALRISDEITPAINVPLAHLGYYALNGNQASLEAGKVVAKATPVNTMWTLASGVDVILPEGVDAYTCEVVNDTQVGIKKIADEDLIVDDQRVIKANNGVLLKGEAGKTYDIVAVPVTKSFGDWIDDYDYKSYGYENQLVPVIYTKSFDASLYYVLSNNAFHPMSNSTENVPAGKAVLYVPGAALSRGVLNITGEDDGTTGINGINADSENGQWYDLQGNRIAAPTKKGLYIKGGKKVIIK